MPPPSAKPLVPVALPLLFLTRSFRSVSRPLLKTPGPNTFAAPVLLTARTLLPLMMLSVTSAGGVASGPLKTAPLSSEKPPKTAPAPYAPPLEAVTTVVLPVIWVLLIVPGPSMSRALPLGPTSADDATFRVAWLPLITLLLIESVVPGPKSAAGGTRIPPPAANTPAGRKGNAGLELFEPPVTVTPEMLTVGSLSANSSPTVRTGPPPLMIVAAALAPTRLTLLSIVTPPLKVPAASLIMSPSWAASTAA